MPVTIDVRVAGTRDLGGDVRELMLEPVGDGMLPAFSAGSHVVVHVPLAAPRFNAYSLACAPWRTDRYRIAVRREGGGDGGSRHLHDDVAVGDALTIEPPRNLFAPPATARRHLLVAGGVGITPFVAYAHRLARDGVPFELHHVAREGACGPLRDELAGLAPRAVHIHSGRAELMVALEGALAAQPLGTHVSACGPVAMMDAVAQAAREHGWPDARLHEERFAVAAGPREPFDIVLGRDGRRVHVSADATLLEALEAAGIKLPYLCRNGVCGECRTRVLDGVPDHRDVFLTAEERAAGADVMPCVSRCASGGTLVLDLA